MKEQEKKKLIQEALLAREYAYAPYSNFRVGAALLAVDGCIFTGCNVENASYSATNCAERTAVFKAVSEGIMEWKGIAVVGGSGETPPNDYISPCGVCRQVLSEFCDPDEFVVLLGKGDGTWKEYFLGELMPLGFSGNTFGENSHICFNT